MANYPRWLASMTLRDYAERDSVWQVYVPEATAKLYFAANDKAARDATAIGTLFGYLLTVSKMKEVQRAVTVIDETAPVATVDEGVLRGNKIVMYGQTGPDGWTLSVPGRDDTAYTLKTNSFEIDIEAAGDFKTFYEAVETTCLGKGGVAIVVQAAALND